jgi:hypothetical protein
MRCEEALASCRMRAYDPSFAAVYDHVPNYRFGGVAVVAWR